MAKWRKFYMPSVWEAEDVPDGATIQLLTGDYAHHVWAVEGDWSQPLGQLTVDSDVTTGNPAREAIADGFSVLLVKPADTPVEVAPKRSLWDALGFGSRKKEEPATGSSNGQCPAALEVYVALRAPNGNIVQAKADGSLTADLTPGPDLPDECVLRFRREEDGTFSLWSMSNERYLRATPDGSLLLVSMKVLGGPDGSRERFRVRHVQLVPKFFGVNLGGWLVAEAWMCPPDLFDGVFKDFTDGTSIQLQSGDGKWVAAEGGGGDQLLANRDAASAWETFFLRRTEEGGLQVRAGSGHYWSVDPDTGEVLANSETAGENETFWLRRKLGDESLVQLRAATGHWVQALESGQLMADIDEDAPGWDTTCTFALKKVSDMGGEVQLGLVLGREAAAERLTRHRDTWVTEDDFAWLAEHGVNAVRLPVGWWATKDPTPAEFVAGSLAYVDKAFSWARKHGIRVVLCLHAAPGSQNGWEHSASRDGVPQWGRPGTDYIQQTMEILEFLVARYAQHPCFAALEPINEPRSDSISFQSLADFYCDAYQLLRRHSATAYFIMEGRIFANEREWDSFMTGAEYTNVVYDAHWYQVHDHAEFGGKSLAFNLQYPSKQRAESIRLVERGHRLVMIGEWSLALLCETNDDSNTKFGRAQVDAYLSSSAGCFFWSLKHGQGWEAWDFQRSVSKGWLQRSWWPWSEPLPLAPDGEDGEDEDGEEGWDREEGEESADERAGKSQGKR